MSKGRGFSEISDESRAQAIQMLDKLEDALLRIETLQTVSYKDVLYALRISYFLLSHFIK